MIEVVRTDDFDEWITKLKDRVGRLRILKRIDRLANGNPGDVKPVSATAYRNSGSTSDPASGSIASRTATC